MSVQLVLDDRLFQVAISTTPGRVDDQHRLSRKGFQRFFAELEPTEVLMEACGTAHHWGRELEAMGHRVRLLPPGDVARYRDGNKTDRRARRQWSRRHASSSTMGSSRST